MIRNGCYKERNTTWLAHAPVLVVREGRKVNGMILSLAACVCETDAHTISGCRSLVDWINRMGTPLKSNSSAKE